MHDDLDRLCAALGVAIAGRHTAPGDALATALVFAALVPRLRARHPHPGRALAERQQQPGLVPQATPPPPAPDRLDSYPYRHRVAEAMSAPPLTLDAAANLAAAIRTLRAAGSSSAFLALPAGWGILTERDVLRALDSHGAAALGMAAGAPTSRSAGCCRWWRARGRWRCAAASRRAARRSGWAHWMPARPATSRRSSARMARS